MVIPSRVFAIFIACLTQVEWSISQDGHVKHFVTQTYEYNKEYTIYINNAIGYNFEHHDSKAFINSITPARISIVSNLATRKFPIFVSARQQKGILSWQIPLVVDGAEMNHVSRTLCPNHNFFNDGDSATVQKHPIINLYTSSETNVSVTVKIDIVNNFYLQSDANINVTVSPSQPGVFFYSFGNELDDFQPDENLQLGAYSERPSKNMKLVKDPKSVGVVINSDDENCMLLSIQNISCPIFDTENDILFEGDYETISKKGAITVMQRNYPLGFYIVLLVKTNDRDCTGYDTNDTMSPFSQFFDFNIQPYDHPDETILPLRQQSAKMRLKKLSLQITPSITTGAYWLATMLALSIIIAVYISFLLGMCVIKFKPLRIEEVETHEAISSLQESGINYQTEIHEPDSACEIAQEIVPDKNDPNILFLDKLCTKNIKIIKQQSSLYLWHVVTISVFYALPVLQLVITYQQVLNKSGNHDLCYYNFLCAHPWGYLSDFNHVYSNVGYILLGSFFLFFVWKRQKRHEDKNFDEHYGIPQRYGLFYAMGVSLIMEGILSASYHVCPNHSNFQFDTTFMYIMAVLSMVTIYQTRHPDINARAHATFGVLAISIFICMLGVFYPNFYFWLFFTILHVGTCFILTMNIYYLGGEWKIRNYIPPTDHSIREAFAITHRSRFILVVIGNVCNLTLAGLGLYKHSKDFASHLLYIFLMNLALHLFFYIVMKLTKSEKLSVYTWILMIMALLTWGGSLYFFFSGSTSWALTPAESRTYNKPCVLFKFYDNHDVWHFLSALAMFFSFMLLLTLDDDITHKLRNNIPVF